MQASDVKSSMDGLCEIRWHGRGGQGAISSAKILAAAAYRGGFKGVTSAPSFGAERRGAPVTASTRMSAEPIRVFSQIEHPNIIVVLDDTLVHTANATSGLQSGGWVIINSKKSPAEWAIEGDYRVATADASGAAEEVGLIIGGAPMVNTAMLGAVARATELVTMEDLEVSLEGAFPGGKAAINYDAARLTYERTVL